VIWLVEETFSFRNFRQFERTRHEIRSPYNMINDLRFQQLPERASTRPVLAAGAQAPPAVR
jgi:hypothetical protein